MVMGHICLIDGYGPPIDCLVFSLCCYACLCALLSLLTSVYGMGRIRSSSEKVYINWPVYML